MPYEFFGRVHAAIYRTLHDDERGQGTVEYVGLMLLLATVLTGVVAVGSSLKGGGIAQEIVSKLKETISGVGDAKPKSK